MSSQWLGQHGAKPPNAGEVPVVTSILKDFSAEALGELRTWLEQNPPSIPVTQILGFTQFTVQGPEYVGATDSTSSVTYVNLANVGPRITGLPDGQYLFLFGGAARTTTTDIVRMAPSYNSSVPSDTEAAETQTSAFSQIMRASNFRFATGGNNTVSMQYRSDGASAEFGVRWLLGLRISN